MALVFLVLFLQGCSTSLAYNHLDWLAQWYLADYVDLNSEQDEKLQDSLTDILSWHRQRELLVYQQQLATLLVDVDKKMPAKRWSSHMSQLRDHFSRVREKVSVQLTQLAPLLSKEQANEFFDNLEQKNQQDVDEYNDLSAQERQEKTYDELYDTLDENLGSVNSAQEKLITQFIQDTPTDTLAYIDYRRKIQNQARSIFVKEKGQALTDRLYELFMSSEQYKSELLKQNSATKIKLTAILLQDIHQSLSNKQLRYFKEEVAEFRLTLRTLMVAGA